MANNLKVFDVSKFNEIETLSSQVTKAINNMFKAIDEKVISTMTRKEKILFKLGFKKEALKKYSIVIRQPHPEVSSVKELYKNGKLIASFSFDVIYKDLEVMINAASKPDNTK